MIELPEAKVLSGQINRTLSGKKISSVIANSSPHKFAWYYGDPAEYDPFLRGRVIESATPLSGRVEIMAEGAAINLGEGVIVKFLEAEEKIPAKHQLLITFDDGSALMCTVAMYGMMMAYPEGAMDGDIYYKASKEAVSPLSDDFDRDCFDTLFDDKSLKLSAKAFLATKQRIPGLGNGVLQDILLNARIHPKTKIQSLDGNKIEGMYKSVKSTLADMAEKGGRDTEKDLFGNYGGYKTMLSKNTIGLPCPICGGHIEREAYLGGNIYFCPACQPV